MFRNRLGESLEHSLDYIIDTDIGGDIDDSIALLLATKSHSKPLAVTTTHIDPEEKGRIAKLILTECGCPNIPVFSGIGSKRTGHKKHFLLTNSLFPPAFGFPNPEAGEKRWYSMQGVAYRESYTKKFQEMKIEKESAPEFIARTAKKFSPDNKLIIVALGPLHNIEAAIKNDASIINNIRLVSMGGVYPKGYNWLISPETSAIVLSQVETICISSEFINRNNLSLSQEELLELESTAQSFFGKTFIADWKNWNRGDFFGKKATFLYDPVTLYLALHSEEIVESFKKRVSFPCLDSNRQLKQELSNCWYYQAGLENKIIQLDDSCEANVIFIDRVSDPMRIKNEIFTAIKQSLIEPIACKKNDGQEIEQSSVTTLRRC